MCIYIYIYIYIYKARKPDPVREMGGAPRNLSPRNHFLVWIVKSSGCHCTDGHLTSRVSLRIQHFVECRPPLGALPQCPRWGKIKQPNHSFEVNEGGPKKRGLNIGQREGLV